MVIVCWTFLSNGKCIIVTNEIKSIPTLSFYSDASNGHTADHLNAKIIDLHLSFTRAGLHRLQRNPLLNRHESTPALKTPLIRNFQATTVHTHDHNPISRRTRPRPQ